MEQDYLSHNVAVNLKRIRQSKGMSLERVSEQTGVSKSMLAQIEKGTANPSLGVLGKITSGLRIEVQDLIDPPKEDYLLVNPEDMVPTKEMPGQYTVWTCFPFQDSNIIEIYRIDIEPGASYTSGGHGENTREYITVLDGVVAIESHDHLQEITKDQVYKFETDQTHVYHNPGDKRASFISFFLDYSNL